MSKLLKLELRSLRGFLLIPIAAVYIVLPLMNATSIAATGWNVQAAAQLVLDDGQKIIALFIVWWPMLILKEYLNSPGNELLFVFLKGKNRLLSRMPIIFGLHFAIAAPVLIAYAVIFNNYYWVYWVIALQCLLFLSFSYMLAIVFKNTFLPIVISVLYCVSCFAFKLGSSSVFVADIHSLSPHVFIKYAVMFILTLVFFTAGYICERRIYHCD